MSSISVVVCLFYCLFCLDWRIEVYALQTDTAKPNDTILNETVSQIDDIIDNFAEFYAQSESNLRSHSEYTIFSHDKINAMPLFNSNTRTLYLRLFGDFFDRISAGGNQLSVTKLAHLATGFFVYNELLNAMEDKVDWILKSNIMYSKKSTPQNDPNARKMRDYLSLILAVYSDHNFLNEDKYTRLKLKNSIQTMMGKHLNIDIEIVYISAKIIHKE